MDKGGLQRYVGRDAAAAGGNVIEFETEDLGTFGWVRGLVGRSLMLELRKASGNCLAVGYGWIHEMEYDPSHGIALRLSGGRTILIRGRNLNDEVRPTVRLFEGLTRHRISWIREAGQAECLAAPEGACVVEAIEW